MMLQLALSNCWEESETCFLKVRVMPYFRALGGFVINFFKYIDGVLMVLSTGKYSCLVDLLVLINL